MDTQSKTTNNWDAADYAQSSSAQKKWADELLSGLSLKGREVILDVGCGDGKITAEIASRLNNGSVVGIDQSSEMIELAQKRYRLSNLQFQQIDASQIEYEELFDIIFSNAALHWIRDHSNLLERFFRSLKPKGRLLLQMGGKGNCQAFAVIARELIVSPEWRKYFLNFSYPYFFYSDKEYKKWLSSAGFTIENVSLIPKDMVHQDSQELKGWLRTTWFPFTDCLPDQRRDDFLETMLSQYLSTVPPDSSGMTHVDMVRLEVHAIKK